MEIEEDLVDLEVEPSAENCGTRQEVWREELHQLRRHLKMSVVVVLTAGPYHQHCLSPHKMSLRLRNRQRRRTMKSRSLQSR